LFFWKENISLQISTFFGQNFNNKETNSQKVGDFFTTTYNMNLVFKFFLISYFQYFQIWLKGFMGAFEHHKFFKKHHWLVMMKAFSSASSARV
jgi:hypothetical protein